MACHEFGNEEDEGLFAAFGFVNDGWRVIEFQFVFFEEVDRGLCFDSDTVSAIHLVSVIDGVDDAVVFEIVVRGSREGAVWGDDGESVFGS